MNPIVVLATWAALSWTAPDSTVAVEAQRANATHAWTKASLYAAPLATSPPPAPIPALGRGTAFVSISTDPKGIWGGLAGGQAIRLRYQHADGRWDEWSNYVVIAAGLRDTLWSDEGDGIVYPGSSGIARWARTYGDSSLTRWGSATGPVMHYETLVTSPEMSARLLSIFGYYCVAGARVYGPSR